MASMVHPTAALTAVETACHLDGLACVKIENVVPILGSLEVSHRAGDTQHVEVV